MVAVERLHEYTTDVEIESRAARGSTILPYLWPSQGVVAFNDVSLRYRYDYITLTWSLAETQAIVCIFVFHYSDGNAYALRNITFESGPCEKIG